MGSGEIRTGDGVGSHEIIVENEEGAHGQSDIRKIAWALAESTKKVGAVVQIA